MNWYDLKLLIEHATGWSMDALHVIAGILLQLLAAWLLKSSISRALPLYLVLAAAVANEVNDLLVESWPQAAMQYGESIKDLALTMLLPTLLHGIARRRPQLVR